MQSVSVLSVRSVACHAGASAQAGERKIIWLAENAAVLLTTNQHQ
jgi:hypothetical protein